LIARCGDEEVLFGGLVENPSKVPHQLIVLFFWFETSNQDDQNKRLSGIDDGSIVVDFGDVPRLVGHPVFPAVSLRGCLH